MKQFSYLVFLPILFVSILVQHPNTEHAFAQSYNVVQKKDLVYPIAGTGVAEYTGDGSSALYAGFNDPTGIAIDSDGNLYIADSGNHVIRRVDAETGTITTIAGTGTAGFSGDSGPALEMQLNNPQYLDVAENGDLFISDVDNNRLRKITAESGILSTVHGTPTLIPGQIAIDDLNGMVYFTDSADNYGERTTGAQIWSIMRVLPSGNIAPFLIRASRHHGPVFFNDIGLDILGNPFVVMSSSPSSWLYNIVRHNRDSANQDSVFVTERLINVFSVSMPNIFFTTNYGPFQKIFRYGAIKEGPGFQTVGKEEIGTSTLDHPIGEISDMVMDLDGNVIFADWAGNKIYRITNNNSFEPNIQVPQAVDFDEIVVGTTKTTSLPISNTGNMKLSILDISSPVPDISILPTSADIERGDSTNIAIAIKPTAAGPISGTISILSTDPDQANLPIPVTAEAFSAQLQMDLEKGPNNQNVHTMKGVTTADTITVQIFGTDMPRLSGYQITLEYDDTYIDSESFSFESGSLLPDALAVMDHTENSITVSAVITGEASSTIRSGLMGSLDLAITDNLASTDSTFISLTKSTYSLADASVVETLQQSTATLYASESVVGDFDGDGSVGFPDFLQFAQVYGKHSTDADFDSRFDLDNDGAIGFSDFLIFATSFGA